MNLFRFVTKEIGYLKSFTSDQKILLFSFLFYALASPFITTFTNTFLWRMNESAITLALYNIGAYTGTALGFLANTLLLSFLSAKRLYAFGATSFGLPLILLVFCPPTTYFLTVIFGMLLGVSIGLYWSNRNTLTSSATQGEKRFAFISVETVLGKVISVFVPAFIGFFIVSRSNSSVDRVQGSYEIVVLISFLLLVLTGLIIKTSNGVPSESRIKQVFIKNPSKLWIKLRQSEYASGFMHGIEMLIPLLFILNFLGLEDAVGIVKSLTAILSSLCMYILGKIIQKKDQTRLLWPWFWGTFLSVAVVAIFFNTLGVIVFFLLFSFVYSFRWPMVVSAMYECVDYHLTKRGGNRFAYLLDRELFLNMGRVTSLLLFIPFYLLFPVMTVRFGLVAVVFVQVFVVVRTRNILASVQDHVLVPATKETSGSI